MVVKEIHKWKIESLSAFLNYISADGNWIGNNNVSLLDSLEERLEVYETVKSLIEINRKRPNLLRGKITETQFDFIEEVLGYDSSSLYTISADRDGGATIRLCEFYIAKSFADGTTYYLEFKEDGIWQEVSENELDTPQPCDGNIEVNGIVFK